MYVNGRDDMLLQISLKQLYILQWLQTYFSRWMKSRRPFVYYNILLELIQSGENKKKKKRNVEQYIFF